MSIIDRILTILTPYECLGCSAEGDLLCETCERQLPRSPECCYRCREPSIDALTCSVCRDVSDLYRVWVGTAYSGTAKELVLRLKFNGARTAARNMVARMPPLTAAAGGATVIVPVPTASSRVRGRGYDQAKLLARELSRRTHLPYLDCLARSGHTRQVGTSRHRRFSQLEGVFRINDPTEVAGADIILVDDVLTTGATLEAAAKILKARGANRVSATIFAQA